MDDGSLQAGEVLDGKYTIESKLGQGSFGAVYRAVQESIGRTVAIKVLIPRSEQDAEVRHRFKREAKLSSQLHSPHTIKLHDFGELGDGRMFIVMEYLEGRPLDKIVFEHGAMTIERTAHIARQTLESLSEAHQKGIVHRDLKPENVFICSNMAHPDFVKVFDFGIAKVVGGGEGGTLKETAKLTMTGGTVGTPAYMSPEQCYGKELTGASDLYSLGILMYEMLTGRLPFENANPVQTMMRQINDPPPPMPAHVESHPIAQIVRKVLEKAPQDRYASAQEFLDALNALDTSGEEAPQTQSTPNVAKAGLSEEIGESPTIVTGALTQPDTAADDSPNILVEEIAPAASAAPPFVTLEPELGPIPSTSQVVQPPTSEEKGFLFWVLVGGGIAAVIAVIVIAALKFL